MHETSQPKLLIGIEAKLEFKLLLGKNYLQVSAMKKVQFLTLVTSATLGLASSTFAGVSPSFALPSAPSKPAVPATALSIGVATSSAGGVATVDQTNKVQGSGTGVQLGISTAVGPKTTADVKQTQTIGGGATGAQVGVSTACGLCGQPSQASVKQTQTVQGPSTSGVQLGGASAFSGGTAKVVQDQTVKGGNAQGIQWGEANAHSGTAKVYQEQDVINKAKYGSAHGLQWGEANAYGKKSTAIVDQDQDVTNKAKKGGYAEGIQLGEATAKKGGTANVDQDQDVTNISKYRGNVFGYQGGEASAYGKKGDAMVDQDQTIKSKNAIGAQLAESETDNGKTKVKQVTTISP